MAPPSHPRDRVAFPCAADKPICPRCGTPVRRTHVLAGYLVARCDGKVRLPGASDLTPCAAHLLMLAGAGAVCFVTSFTADEYKELTKHIEALTGQEMYRRLGMLLNRERPTLGPES